VARGHTQWLGAVRPPLKPPVHFFEFFFKKNKYFYLFLINLYFFIKMDTCR
jgi:hypothetical protein